MNPFNDQSLKSLRKGLRSQGTPEEVILWNCLKASKLGYKFRRQTSIGRYIVDFFCPEFALVIELDGSQHLDQEEYDKDRSNYLQQQGCKVLRFWNGDIRDNLGGVLMKIQETIHTTPPRFTRHPS